MHTEVIRCNPAWYGKFPRYDTVLVNLDPDAPGMAGMLIARIAMFLSFEFEGSLYLCALVEWFETVGEEPDPVTGMWMVRPELVNNERATSLIHVGSIVRACHLLPVCDPDADIPLDFHFSDTLDAFDTYYVNRFIDYHTHETVF